MSYRALFSNPRGGQPTQRLLDAFVELLVRLHLSGFFWGDCSLSNTLFRFDAGTLEAYLVDAETSERHPSLSDGQRNWDVELAIERVAGEFLDLQAGALLPSEVDPFEIAEELPRRYECLWDELTREEILRPDDQRYRIAERLGRLNELGFDVDEVELVTAIDGNKLRLRTRVAESGHHSRQLFLRTGLSVEENQARRLLNDIASFRGYDEQRAGHPVSEIVAANRWLEEVYDPGRGDSPWPAWQARPRGNLPRDPRASLVPVRGSVLRRGNDRGRALVFRDRAAFGSCAVRRAVRRHGLVAAEVSCRGTSRLHERGHECHQRHRGDG